MIKMGMHDRKESREGIGSENAEVGIVNGAKVRSCKWKGSKWKGKSIGLKGKKLHKLQKLMDC